MHLGASSEHYTLHCNSGNRFIYYAVRNTVRSVTHPHTNTHTHTQGKIGDHTISRTVRDQKGYFSNNNINNNNINNNINKCMRDESKP